MSLSYETDEPVEATTDQTEVIRPAQPLAIYTFILIGAFALVAVVQLSTGLERSILLAGFDKPVFRAGEYWRILTGAALHGGILHVALNGYAFYSFGKIFEMLAHRAHLAIVFLLAAIGGGVLSFLLAPDGISVGASGGIVGLIGYLAVYTFKRRDFISPEFRRSLLTNIGFILIYGLVMYRTIDNFGHIGGLLTGAAYAFVQIPSDPYADPRAVSSVTRTLGLIAVAVYLATCVFSILRMLGVL